MCQNTKTIDDILIEAQRKEETVIIPIDPIDSERIRKFAIEERHRQAEALDKFRQMRFI